jgi:hypothetical protein
VLTFIVEILVLAIQIHSVLLMFVIQTTHVVDLVIRISNFLSASYFSFSNL